MTLKHVILLCVWNSCQEWFLAATCVALGRLKDGACNIRGKTLTLRVPSVHQDLSRKETIMEAVQVGFWARCWAGAEKALFGTVASVTATAQASKAKMVEVAKAGYALAQFWAKWVKEVIAMAYANTVAAASAWADKAQEKFTMLVNITGLLACALFMVVRTFVEVVFYRIDNGLRSSWTFRNLATQGLFFAIIGVVTGWAYPLAVAAWIFTGIYCEVIAIIWWRGVSAEHRSYVLQREYQAELTA
jgi:hypothetical protein